MTEPKPPTELIKKLVAVAQAIGTIKKSGYNKHQSYHYATEADLIEAVKEELFKRHIFIFTSSKVTEVKTLTKTETDKDGNKKDTNSLVTFVETIHTFFDGSNGESYSVASAGSGHDATDKGVFKAITGATKYFLSKNFMIASEDDPESDGVTKPAVPAKTGGSLFGKKTPEAKGSGTVTTSKPVEVPVAQQATVTTTPEVVVAPTQAAPVTATVETPKANGTGTLANRPMFNRNRAANESVKF